MVAGVQKRYVRQRSNQLLLNPAASRGSPLAGGGGVGAGGAGGRAQGRNSIGSAQSLLLHATARRGGAGAAAGSAGARGGRGRLVLRRVTGGGYTQTHEGVEGAPGGSGHTTRSKSKQPTADPRAAKRAPGGGKGKMTWTNPARPDQRAAFAAEAARSAAGRAGVGSGRGGAGAGGGGPAAAAAGTPSGYSRTRGRGLLRAGAVLPRAVLRRRGSYGAPGPSGAGVQKPQGRVVQVDPMKPTLRAPGSNRLKLKCDGLLSSFAF
jgi:hypothetical protein